MDAKGLLVEGPGVAMARENLPRVAPAKNDLTLEDQRDFLVSHNLQPSLDNLRVLEAT